MALIGEVASTPVLQVGLDVTARAAAEQMRDAGIAALVVVDADGAVAGMITAGDIAARVVAEGRDPLVTKVSEVCSREVRTLPADSRVEDAEALFTDAKVRRLPIVDAARRPVGIVSIDDLAASTLVGDAELRGALRAVSGARRDRSKTVLHGA